MVIYPLFGALAQLVAHNTGSVGVRSSNLLCSTITEVLRYKASVFCFGKHCESCTFRLSKTARKALWHKGLRVGTKGHILYQGFNFFLRKFENFVIL